MADEICLSAPDFERKVVSSQQLAAVAERLARPVVMTNGVFDLLHRGHVTYLARARQLGASLVVALNSDASVRTLGKGADRPINPQADRAAVLASLASVSLVTIFEQSVPLQALEIVKPDVYVKGGDYDMDSIAETALVRSWGGTAIAIPFEHDRSTTKLLTRLRHDEAG